MAQTDVLKLAKFNAKLQRQQMLHDDLKGFVSHPVVAMIAGCAAVELIQNNIVIGQSPATSAGFQFSPFLPFFHFGSPAKDQMLFSQTLATAIEVAILMWGTKTTVKDVGDVLKTIVGLPAQLAGSAASLAVLAK